MSDWVRGNRTRGAAVLAAVVAGCAAFASMAAANDVNLAGPIAQRTEPDPFNPSQTGTDYGYRGPQFVVRGWGHTSTDTYHCPAGQTVSNFLVVGDNTESNDRAWQTETDLIFTKPTFEIEVTNWSTVYALDLRLAASCTDDSSAFPYQENTKTGNHPYGDYQSYWNGQFKSPRSKPGPQAYAGLIRRAFCWIANSGCPAAAAATTADVGARISAARAKRGGNRFALRNGTNQLSLTFNHRARRRPPAVRLASPRGCRARKMPLSVHDKAGQLLLELRCRGLKRGAAARVTIGKAVRRNFRLRKGSGSVVARLAKPAGSVAPYAHLSYGSADTPCRKVRSRVRLRSRTLALRVTARCGGAAGSAVGHLYVGGLLAARR